MDTIDNKNSLIDLDKSLLTLEEAVEQLDTLADKDSQLSPDLIENLHQIQAGLSDGISRITDSRDQFAALFEQAPMGYVLLDTDFKIIEANTFSRKLLGLSKQGKTSKTFVNFITQGIEAFFDWTMSSSTEALRVNLLSNQSNGFVKLIQRNWSFFDKNYLLLSIVPMDKEVELENSLKIFKQTFEQSQEAILILDSQFNIQKANQAYINSVGLRIEKIINRPPAFLNSQLFQKEKSHQQVNADVLDDIRHDIRYKGWWSGETLEKNADGEWFPVLLNLTFISEEKSEDHQSEQLNTLKNSATKQNDHKDKNGHYVATFKDITELKRKQKKLERQAVEDALTGLLNREGFNQAYSKVYAEVSRAGEAMSLIFIDLDEFKQLNDNYGHDYGDELLKSFAKRLKHQFKKTDKVARLGGDEFVVVLPNMVSEASLKMIANKVLHVISQPYRLFDIEYTCYASLGIASYPDDAVSESKLLKAADDAMYQAKRAGHNRYQIYNVEQLAADRSKELFLKQIKQAILHHEFEFFYQPQTCMQTGKVVGFEALARWRKPNGELVLPDEFIPLIEQDELMLQLGRQLIELAFVQLSVWCKQGLNCPVAINLAAKQLASEQTVKLFNNLSQRYPRLVSIIQLEITETSIFENNPKIDKSINALKSLGFEFVLDDFGTGYSSIYSLKKFDFKKIKIDASFVADIGTKNEKGMAILNAMIDMIRGIGLPIIFEGVELQSQVDYLLNEKKCNFAQGYFYAKPLTKKEMSAFLRECNCIN